MKRRKFLGTSLAASAVAANALAASRASAQEASTTGEREFYQLRRYQLSRPQVKLTNDYLRNAFVPALNRMGMRPVGVFNESIGPGTPVIYALIPSTSLEKLVTLDQSLRNDADYMKAAADFLTAPGKQPAFEREESWLLQAFETHQKITLPPASASGSPRVFELRTYESPSLQDHWRKLEQMNGGEAAIFTKAGIPQVFFGDVLIGSRQPCLTYMICFNSLAERDGKWQAFLTSPEWKALSTDPKYAYEDIVTNITNVILAPTDYSQI